MCMSQWALMTKTKVAPEALYAGAMLERYGFLFGIDFEVSNAIDKAAKVITEHADEEENLLMEGKQIEEKIAIDEQPRIQDRRTSSAWKKNSFGWGI